MKSEARHLPPAENYTMMVSRHDDRFRIDVPELSVRVQDASLQAAYEKAVGSCNAMIQEYRDAGAEDTIPISDSGGREGNIKKRSASTFAAAPDSVPQDLLLFSAKTLIAMASIAVVLLFVSSIALQSLRNNTTKGLSLREHIRITAERLQNASPEKKEQMRQDLRVIATEIRPFIQELAGAIKPE